MLVHPLVSIRGLGMSPRGCKANKMFERVYRQGECDVVFFQGFRFGRLQKDLVIFAWNFSCLSLHAHLWWVSAVPSRVYSATDKGSRWQDGWGLTMLGYFEPGFFEVISSFFPSEMLYLVKRYCCIVPRGVSREGMAGGGLLSRAGTWTGQDQGWVPPSLWGLFWRAMLPLRVGWSFLLKASIFSCL